MALLQRRNCRMGLLSYCQETNYNGNARYCDLLLRDRLAGANNLFRKDLKGHFGCVNAIEFAHHGGEIIASGGDDRRVLIWNTEKCIANRCVPVSMNGQHHSNIFCLAFASCNRRVFSGGNDEQVVVHDIETKQTVDVFLHEEAVYGLSVDPINDNVFASACDDGKVLLYDIRSSPAEDPFCIANCHSPMHSVTFNPVEPRLITTANAKEGLALWDVRHPKNPLLRYGGKNPAQSCMSVKVSRSGKTLIALRRRLPPVMYNLHEANPVCEFDHNGYYNSCTMKSCCFAGDKDQYIVSGSDDFNLYMWKIPEPGKEVKWVPKAHMVLRGHRSIANQVRFNPDNHLMISSGVEKVIKMWSPFPVPYCQGDLGDGEFDYSERPVYTHEEYINLVLRSGQVMSHDYSNQSTEEDPRMMAFFDSLVQRELEGFSTDDSAHESEDGPNYQPFVVNGDTSDGSNSDTLSNHSLPSDDEEGGLSPFTMAFAVAMARRARYPEDDGDDGGGGGDTDGPEDILDVRSSFMERLDELNNDGNGDGEGSSTLPGQRPNAARRSIAELIDQKRKEYLTKAKNACVEKKRLKAECNKRKTSSMEGNVSSSSSGSSSTSSSENDCESGQDNDKQHNKNRKKVSKSKKKCMKCDENKDGASGSNHDSAAVMKELAAERENMKSRMKRVKAMRNRAMCDLSDSTVSDASSSQTGETDRSRVEVKDGRSHNLNENGVANESKSFKPNSATEESHKGDNHKTDNCNDTSANELTFKDIQNGNLANGTLDTASNINNSTCTQNRQPFSTFCDNETSCSVPHSVNGHGASSSGLPNLGKAHSSTVNRHDSTVDNNGVSTSNGESVDTESQPMWTQFKRFRNRVEKAHRRYRKSSTNADNSACSSGEEN